MSRESAPLPASAPPAKVNLASLFARIHDHWNPRIAADLNGQQVKVVKLKGDFAWHHHEHEDELFFVVRGHLRLELRTGNVELDAGEMLVIPRGVEHRPVAEEEAEVILFEPASTLNTGNLRNERTRDQLERI